MEFKHILFLCCAFCLIKGLITNKRSKMNWFEAQQNCRLNGSVLPNSEDVTNFRSWTGKYRRFSQLIKILGCYSFIQSTNSPNAFRMQIPSAGFCHERCLSSSLPVFAIKDNECRCLEQRLQEGKVSTSLCNFTSCKRDEEPYFHDCGGKDTYSVFQSEPRNETAADVNTAGLLCVAIQCSVPPNFTFYNEEDCSLLYKQFCDMTESNTSATWMKSMQICRSMSSLHVLTEEIYLNDIYKTCKAVGGNRTERYWIGVAKKWYIGIDQEDTVINNQDKGFFNECFICDRTAKSNNDCYVTSCEEQLNVTELCSEIKQEKTTIIGRTTKETNMSEIGTRQITAVTDISSVTTGAQSIAKNTNINKKEVLQIVFLLVDVVLIGGIIFALRLIYLRKKKIKKKQKLKSNQSVSEAGYSGYSEVEVSTEIDLSEVTGIVNHNYFVLELQDQSLRSTDTTCNKETESPYIDSKDGIYDHLREHRERKVNEENTYDETNKGILIPNRPYIKCKEMFDNL